MSAVPVPSSLPNKTFVAIGFVAATLITTGLTTMAGVVSSGYQTNRTEKIAQVDAFVKSTQAFDPLVRSYMTSVLESGDMDAARGALEANIQQQHILLGAADDYLSGSSKSQADEYRATLVEIEEGLETQTRNPLTGRKFAQGIADAAAERERVIADLRKSAGLSDGR